MKGLRDVEKPFGSEYTALALSDFDHSGAGRASQLLDTVAIDKDEGFTTRPS